MKKLLACVFLLNLFVVSSGFGMKEENLEVPECDLQENCLDESSIKWEEMLDETLKNKQKFYEEHKVPAAVIECIFTVGYNETCKKALVKMFKHFEGEFRLGKLVLAGDLLNYEVEYIEPCFLQKMALKFKIDVKDLPLTFENLIMMRFEGLCKNAITLLTCRNVYDFGADFIASYIEAISRSVSGRKIEDLEKEIFESAGFKLSETLKAFLWGTHQGQLSYEQSEAVVLEIEKIEESMIFFKAPLKMSVYRACDRSFLTRHFGPVALIQMGILAVIEVVSVSSPGEKKDVR